VPHSRSVLAARFWPELAECRARRNLNNALWELRLALKTPSVSTHSYILSDSQTVQFNASPAVWLDVAEFEGAAARFLEPDLALSEFTEAEIASIGHAVSLYRGDFLEGTYDDWCLVQRERLREQYLWMLEKLTLAYRSQGQLEAALITAQQLAQVDPLREEAHFQLVQLYTVLGRWPEAHAQFGRYARLWNTELKARPSARMEALQLRAEPSAASAVLASSALESVTHDLQQLKEFTEALKNASLPDSESGRLWRLVADGSERVGHALQAEAAYPHALRYLTLAAEALSHFPDSSEQGRRELVVRLQCDDLYCWKAEREKQADNLVRARRLSEALEDPGSHADVLARQAWLISRDGRCVQAILLLRKVLQLCRTVGCAGPSALAHRLLGVILGEMGDFEAALAHHGRALIIDESLTLSQNVILDLSHLAGAWIAIGNYPAALSRLERAQSLFNAASSLLARALLAGHTGSLWLALGHFATADDHLREAISIARQLGCQEIECWLGGRLAALSQRSGDLAHALMNAHYYYQVALDIRSPRHMTELADVLTGIYCEQADGKRALVWASRLDELGRLNRYWRFRYRCAMRRAQAYLLLNQTATAFECAQSAVVEFEKKCNRSEDEPDLYHTLARCGQAIGYPDVVALASRRAQAALMRQASWITDSRLRRQFLVHHPLHHLVSNTPPIDSVGFGSPPVGHKALP
jgi:DNA-binding SARP family transcriptional activator